jgi:hypothetical protein
MHSQDYFKGEAPYKPEVHLWKERVIVLQYTEPGQALLEEQLRILKENAEGLRDRQLVVYLDKSSRQGRITDRPRAFTFLLFGKDGGEKLRKYEPIEIELLFSTIDAMPMRIREMRQE